MVIKQIISFTFLLLFGQNIFAQKVFFKPGILKQSGFSDNINYINQYDPNVNNKPYDNFFTSTGLYLGALIQTKKGEYIELFYAENKSKNQVNINFNDCDCNFDIYGSYYKNYNRLGIGVGKYFEKININVYKNISFRPNFGIGVNALITNKKAFNVDTFSALIPNYNCSNGFGVRDIRYNQAPIEKNTFGYFIKSGITIFYKGKPKLNVDIVYNKSISRTHRTWYEYKRISCNDITTHSGFVESKAKNINIEFTIPIKLYERK